MAAARAAVARAHAAHGLARAQERAQDVDVEHALQARQAHVFHAAGHVHHAGVVDQRVQPAPLCVNGGKHGQHLRLVGHVGLHGECGAAAGVDLLHHGLGASALMRS
jgi:hypothetical protein